MNNREVLKESILWTSVLCILCVLMAVFLIV